MVLLELRVREEREGGRKRGGKEGGREREEGGVRRPDVFLGAMPASEKGAGETDTS